ncbi:MAG: hypothetical protein R6V29_05040 [Spirochaetia bacterium]
MQRATGPQQQYRYLIVDFLLVALLLVNLVLIIFDWLFAADAIRSFLHTPMPGFTEWYAAVVHPNFILIDLAFVAVFLTDFLVSWIIAIVKGTYHRWFFYPFIHWYDLLGCIPIAGFRFLRLLRVVSIFYRLHRTGLIDLADTPPGRTIAKYYEVMLEEVSDRVIIKMLSDAQDEVRHGGALLDSIISDVLQPKKAELVEWMSQRLQSVAALNYERYRGRVQSYVRRRVAEALAENKEFELLSSVPLAGSIIRKRVERGISEMISSVMNGVASDLASERNKPVIDEAADLAFDTLVLNGQEGRPGEQGEEGEQGEQGEQGDETEINRIVIDTVNEAIELVKRHVAVQRWKLKDVADDDQDFARRVRREYEQARQREG